MLTPDAQIQALNGRFARLLRRALAHVDRTKANSPRVPAPAVGALAAGPAPGARTARRASANRVVLRRDGLIRNAHVEQVGSAQTTLAPLARRHLGQEDLWNSYALKGCQGSLSPSLSWGCGPCQRSKAEWSAGSPAVRARTRPTSLEAAHGEHEKLGPAPGFAAPRDRSACH